jgi:hypothetical protein
VERLRQTAGTIKASVEHHKLWLEEHELSLLKHLKEITDARFEVETAQAQCVLKLIGKCVEQCEPIREEWLLAPDVVCVCKRRLVVPPTIPPPTAVVEEFPPNKLNDQQAQYLSQVLASAGASISSGTGTEAGNVTVIEEDMRVILEGLLSNGGPLGHVMNPTNRLLSLTLPRNWRKPVNAVAGGPSADLVLLKGADDFAFADMDAEKDVIQVDTSGFLPVVSKDSILQQLLPVVKLPGLEEHVGVVDSATVYEYLTNLESC